MGLCEAESSVFVEVFGDGYCTNEMWHGEVKWIRNLPSSLDRYKAERSVGWREKTPTTISYLILRKYISYDRLNRRIFNTITGHPFSRSSMCVRTENGT